ncbi:MAG: biotin--[acetyl-CoA-carboxylase] ligase [Bacteroidales bacterium]|nr:biotin--[acetyl-CoA-carboxylase] ligase [Bacteroidales bacterium]
MIILDNILWHDCLSSTNTYAREHIQDLDNMSVVAALAQTGGRGQGEHTWESEPGRNLLISIVLKDVRIPASQQTLISDAVACSVVQLLDEYGIKAWIKPPNDVWVGEKKICGILIEHSLLGSQIRWSIIGVGLNVNQTIFPDHLPNPTSMSLEGAETDIQPLLVQFMEIFSSRCISSGIR